MIDQFAGLRVITSVWLTEPGEPVAVKRTWKERLWSRPWRPWQSTRTYIPQVPRKDALRAGDTLYMHPQTWLALQRVLSVNK